MTRPGPSAVEIDLSDDERAELRRWAGGAVSPTVVLRAGIVLACSEGLSNVAAATWCSTTTATVGMWRARFAQRRLAGLLDQPRSGRPTVEVVLGDGERATLTRWARRRRRLWPCGPGSCWPAPSRAPATSRSPPVWDVHPRRWVSGVPG